MGRSPLAAALAGAVIADIAAGRAGVRWDDPDEAPPAGARAPDHRVVVLRRILSGAGLGALAVVLTLLAALVLGWVRVELGSPSPSLALALVRHAALAVRNELVLTGIVLAAASRARVSPRCAVPFAALAHGAVVALIPAVTPGAVALAVASGGLFASLWHRYRGAWAAVAASAVWGLLVGAGLRGGLLDATWVGGALSMSARASGRAIWLASAALLAVAALAAPVGRAIARRRSGRAASVGPAQ